MVATSIQNLASATHVTPTGPERIMVSSQGGLMNVSMRFGVDLGVNA